MSVQLTMFGVDPEPEVVFNVYHDESGTYTGHGGERWLLHGVLLVPASRQEEVFTLLQQARQETRYWEEIHYIKLRKSVRGPKASCSRKWLHLYGTYLSDFCYYHCLAIDTWSPAFEHNRFSAPQYAYNRFARMAVEGAIAWSLKKYKRVALRFYSDNKFRVKGDNFADYLPREVVASLTKKRKKKPSAYPAVRLLHPRVIGVESNPKKVEPELLQESELIQLVDLLTSNIAQALTGRSSQKAKIALAEMVAKWIDDVQKPPWLQTRELHRRFSVSCFPDSRGRFYDPVLSMANKGQKSFFD